MTSGAEVASPRRRITLVALGVTGVLLACALTGYAYRYAQLNSSGFCHEQNRFLADRELVDIALVRQVQTNRAGEEREERIKYETPADLERANPKCCVVIRDDHPFLEANLKNRRFGTYLALVEVTYRARPGGPTPFDSDTYWITACGEIIERAGMSQASG